VDLVKPFGGRVDLFAGVLSLGAARVPGLVVIVGHDCGVLQVVRVSAGGFAGGRGLGDGVCA
jgi:hypothetical protein